MCVKNYDKSKKGSVFVSSSTHEGCLKRGANCEVPKERGAFVISTDKILYLGRESHAIGAGEGV